MDAISYSYADKQAKRIKKFINDPDSTSGIITVPKVIASGESITVPAGRVAVLPNVQVDGTLNVQGDVFIPSGATLSGVVEKVASTDNAVVRFNGTTGEVQNSGVIVDDADNITQRASLYKRVSDNVSVATIDAIEGVSLNFNDYTGGGFSFYSSSIERMRITSSGNLLVGTTTDNGVDKLQVNGSIKATELNVSANYITKVSKNVPGIITRDYTDKYFILFKTPTWGSSAANYSVKGSLIAERVNNLGVTVYTDFSVGCGHNNAIHKTYFQDKGNVGTSLVYVTINSIQYVAIYWYTDPPQHFAWFDGFITNINASSVIDNLCGTIFVTEKNALSRIIV